MGTDFFGSHERALDQKGRVILPAKLRGDFGESALLVSDLDDGCLGLYDPADLEPTKTEMLALLHAESEADRMYARRWARSIHEVTFDAQGRIQIPAEQRTFAGLGTEVLVHGSIERVEFWNPPLYREKEELANARIEKGSPASSPQ
jgi:MraZ protein